MQRSSLKIFTAYCAYRNADLNLTPVTGTTNGSFIQIINSLIESFWCKLDLPWLLTLDFVCLLFYLQYLPVQTDAPATGAANIDGLNFSCLFEKAEIQIPVNKYECPQRLSFSQGNLFWGSFTNHNTGNYLRHGINITTNQRLSATFRGNGNTIIVGDSQTSPPPIFPEGGWTSLHRLEYVKRYPWLRFC